MCPTTSTLAAPMRQEYQTTHPHVLYMPHSLLQPSLRCNTAHGICITATCSMCLDHGCTRTTAAALPAKTVAARHPLCCYCWQWQAARLCFLLAKLPLRLTCGAGTAGWCNTRPGSRRQQHYRITAAAAATASSPLPPTTAG